MIVGLLVTLLSGGCAPPESAPDPEAERLTEADGRMREHRPQVVDSIRPIAEELARFRASLAEEPAALRGGAPSRDELVRRFLDALAERDSVALRQMLLSRAEFALLYYPHTPFTTRPYELSPQLLWFQIQNGTGRGIGRALRRFGGAPLPTAGYRCRSAADPEGPNLLWRDCQVLLLSGSGEAVPVRLFGSILERDGRFKFVSYSNSL